MFRSMSHAVTILHLESSVGLLRFLKGYSMKTSTLMLGCLVLGLSTLGAFANADVIIGTRNFDNDFPFGNSTFAPYSGEYQQLYSSTAFPGPITITQIQFASAAIFSAGTENLDFNMSLETTSASPSAPGGYADNIAGGTGLTQVFSGSLAYDALVNGTFDLSVPITPFAYDPSDGNLLLDVNIISASGGSVTFMAGFDPNEGRVFNLSGSGAQTQWGGFGLVTKFVTASSAVPEPGPIAMLGCLGLAGVAFLRRHRG